MLKLIKTNVNEICVAETENSENPGTKSFFAERNIAKGLTPRKVICKHIKNKLMIKGKQI